MDKIQELKQKGYSVTNAAGIYPDSRSGAVPLGVSKLGAPMFGNPNLMQLNAPKAGQGTIQGVQELLRPVGAFNEADHVSLNKIGESAGNETAIKELTDLSNGEASSPFVNKLHSHFGIEPTDQSKVSALNLAHTFTKMSPAQKSLGIAAFAMQNHVLPGGENVYNKPIISETTTSPEINTGQFLNLMSKGVNAYPLVGKFPEHTTLSTLAGGGKNLNDVAAYAHTNNLLGQGLTGAEVPLSQESKAALDNSFRHAPQFGPGAVVGRDATKLPPGYQNVGKIGGSIVGSPKGTVPMAQGALQSGVVGTNAGENGVSSSASNIYKNWAPTSSKEMVGKNGGSALSAGLINLSKTSPFTYSANIGAALLKNNNEIPKDSADYITHLGAITLSRLEHGGATSEIDAKGMSMAKDLSSIPASQKIDALKLAFTTKGIQSKGDAYQLANQGFGEKRFTDSDLVAMHQVINNIFDKPSTTGVNQLLSGKNHLAQIWGKLPDSSTTAAPVKKIKSLPKTKEEAIAQNQAQFSGGA